jgi:hypothetical protein
MLSQIYTDLSVAQSVPQFPTGCVSRHILLTTSLIHLHLYLDGSLPRTPLLNFRSQITGNLAAYGFAFSPQLLHRWCLAAIPSDVLRARTRASFLVGSQGRRGCNFTTTSGVNSCLDGGCNGGLQCDPHTGTVRLSPTIFMYTQLTHPLCLPFLSLGAMQGVPPATVAEWTLQSNNSQDFYDGARTTFLPIPHLLIRKRPD